MLSLGSCGPQTYDIQFSNSPLTTTLNYSLSYFPTLLQTAQSGYRCGTTAFVPLPSSLLSSFNATCVGDGIVNVTRWLNDSGVLLPISLPYPILFSAMPIVNYTSTLNVFSQQSSVLQVGLTTDFAGNSIGRLVCLLSGAINVLSNFTVVGGFMHQCSFTVPNGIYTLLTGVQSVACSSNIRSVASSFSIVAWPKLTPLSISPIAVVSNGSQHTSITVQVSASVPSAANLFCVFYIGASSFATHVLTVAGSFITCNFSSHAVNYASTIVHLELRVGSSFVLSIANASFVEFSSMFFCIFAYNFRSSSAKPFKL